MQYGCLSDHHGEPLEQILSVHVVVGGLGHSCAEIFHELYCQLIQGATESRIYSYSRSPVIIIITSWAICVKPITNYQFVLVDRMVFGLHSSRDVQFTRQEIKVHKQYMTT